MKEFVDYYEILQVSEHAEFETIERVFRLLAKRFHPDNQDSGDERRFRDVQTAYEVLGDPEQRARYDVRYGQHRGVQWEIFDQDAAPGCREDDQRIFIGVLSLLYVARRRDPELGGLGQVHLERMLGVPREHLEFPIWYLKKKGLIEILQTGKVAITVNGIDDLTAKETAPDSRFLTALAEGNGARMSARQQAGYAQAD